MREPIDELYKNAFPKKDIPFKEEYWSSLEANLPASAGGSLFSSIAAKTILGVISAVSIVGATLYVNQGSVSKELPIASQPQNTSKPQSQEPANSVFQSSTDLILAGNSNSPNIGLQKDQTLFEESGQEVYNSKPNSEPTYGASENVISPLDEKLDNHQIVSENLVDLPSNTQEASSINHSSEVGLMSIKTLPLADNSVINESRIKTEFGQTTIKPTYVKYFGELIGGVHYIDGSGLKDVKQSGSLRDLMLEITSQHETEMGVNVGLQKGGLRFYSGIRINDLEQSYKVKYSEIQETISSSISSSTNIDYVDSSFVEYQYQISSSNGSEHVQIANAIFTKDTVYKTVYDTSYTSKQTTQEKEASAAYQLRYIQIPIMVGYQIELKRFFVEVNTGVTLGLLKRYSGNTFDEETGKIQSGVNENLLNKSTWKYNLDAGIGYRFNPRVSFSINPTLSHAINGPFKSSSLYSYQYTSYGVRCGVRIGF